MRKRSNNGVSLYTRNTAPQMSLDVSFRNWFGSLLMFWPGYIVHMLGYIGHTLEHIVTKICCHFTYIGGDMGHQPQGNRLKAVYFNITGRRPRMALNNISCLLHKTAGLPNYFLQWIYFTYSCIPHGKVWLRWCLGVNAYIYIYMYIYIHIYIHIYIYISVGFSECFLFMCCDFARCPF